MVKRWRTGLIAQDAPQPPIGGTQHTLNHFAGDPHYDTQYCKELIRKHVRKRKWDTHEPTWSKFQGCLRDCIAFDFLLLKCQFVDASGHTHQ